MKKMRREELRRAAVVRGITGQGIPGDQEAQSIGNSWGQGAAGLWEGGSIIGP